MFSLRTNCVKAVSVAWEKPGVKRTQVIRRLLNSSTKPASIHSYPQMVGKFHLVLSPVYPQLYLPNFQMEQLGYAQYPQHLLLRLLFNIIREKHS